MFTVELDPDAIAGLTDEELERLIADAQAVLATRRATRQQTRLHHTGEEET